MTGHHEMLTSDWLSVRLLCLHLMDPGGAKTTLKQGLQPVSKVETSIGILMQISKLRLYLKSYKIVSCNDF